MAAGCVLRASGAAFLVDEFLAASNLKPCKIWHVGEQRFKKPPYPYAGFNLPTSDAEDLSTEIAHTADFLIRNRSELLRLRKASGLEHLVLDFAISRRNVAAQFDRFPAEFVQLAAEFNMAIELSQYSRETACATQPHID